MISVLFNLIISDPSSVPKGKPACDMHNFSLTKFEDALSIKLNKIPLQQDPNTLLQHYELAVRSALDIQAPNKSRTMKCRLRHPWYNASIHLAREILCANENEWRLTKLEVHHQIYVEHRENVNEMISVIKQAKMNYYESEFATGKQDACSCVIKNWHRCLEECFQRPAVLKSWLFNVLLRKKSTDSRKNYDPVSCYG